MGERPWENSYQLEGGWGGGVNRRALSLRDQSGEVEFLLWRLVCGKGDCLD